MHSDMPSLGSEEKGCLTAFAIWFFVVVVVGLGVLGVIIWAIIHLVNWITSH